MIDLRERNKILGAIKRVFSRSPLRKTVLEKALSKQRGPRGGKMYKCSACKQIYGSREVQVDHKDPVIPIGTAFKDMSWDLVIEQRLYCNPKNLQVLCSTCHKEKSRKEAKERAACRQQNK